MKLRFIRFCLLALGLSLVTGCGPSKFEVNYQGINPSQAPAGQYLLCEAPGLWVGSYSAEEAHALATAQGLELVGVSHFQDSSYSAGQAENYAKQLGVCLIFLDKQFSHTYHGVRVEYVVVGHETHTIYDKDGNVTGTVTTEITERRETPYTIDYFNYTAYFFARPAPAGQGSLTENLAPTGTSGQVVLD